MEIGKQGTQQTARYRLIVKEAPDHAQVAQVIAQRVGGSENHILGLLRSLPAQVATDLDPLYAEDLAGALREIGVIAEKKIIPSSVTCSEHPSQPGRATCLVCGKVVCTLCMKEADGQPLCAEHSGKEKYDVPSTFSWLRLTILLIFIGSGFLAYHLITRERGPFTWDRPYKIAVVGFMVDLPTKWQPFIIKFQEETGKGYIDLRNHTLPDLVGWFQREYERYGGRMPQAVELEIFGPFDEVSSPPEPPTADQPLFDRLSQLWRFKSHSRKFSQRHDLKLDDFDGVLYVQFVTSDFEGFTENWLHRKLNTAIVNCYVNQDLIEQDIMIVMHEFFHLLSAKDHYDQNFNPINPDGLANPFLDPPYPQDFADIMTGRVAEAEDSSRNIIGISDLRVNIYTAHEIGWISDEDFQQMIDTQQIPALE